MGKRKKLAKRLRPFGPTALVTGATDGIGEASAEELARAGFDVILSGRRSEKLLEISSQLEETYHIRTGTITADLSTQDGLQKVLAEIDAVEIGVAVLAAGFGTSGTFLENDIENESNMMAVNCDAVLRLTHALATKMRNRDAGQIVLFSSIVAFQGNAYSANYAATKSWVQSFAEGLAVELQSQNTRVLSVAPGPVNSGFAERASMQMGAALSPKTIGKAIRKNIGRSGTIRPGLLSKILGWSLAITPRPIRTQIMTNIMRGMASESEKTS